MVSRGRVPLTLPRRRAIVAFLAAATVVWWHVHRDGLFHIIGLDEPASSLLGPLLPAVSAGLAAAMTLSVVDAAAGTVAGVIAAIVVVALPGFLPLHHESLSGPPLLALTLLMLGLMLHAPRFSVAYGTLAAIAAVYVDPAGLGLPLAAVAWAVIARRPGSNGSWPRVGLALLPLVVALAAARWTGDAWPDGGVLAWRGRLDEGLRAAGRIVGDQLAPTLGSGALRWFAIADVSLILLAVLVVAWRRGTPHDRPDGMLRRLLLGAVVLAAAIATGLTLRWLLVPAAPEPSLTGVFPIAALLAMASVAAVASLWPRWPRWGRALAVILIVGWLQAAVRA